MLAVLLIALLGLVEPETAQEPPSLDRRMVVTVDDLPVGPGRMHSTAEQSAITTKLIATLRKHRVPAIGFVNEDKLEVDGKVSPERVAFLKRWLDAGFELGNHGYSHLDLHRVEPKVWEQDILRGERILRPLLAERGQKPIYFRHPFLHTGTSLETKRRTEKFLSDHGYRVAPVTIDNQEWIFGGAYAHARGDAALQERIGEAYLDYMEAIVEYYEAQSQAITGREIPQILLIHAYALNADWLGQLLDRIEARGYRYLPLEEALQDPVYTSKDEFTGRGGITWLHRWAITRKMAGSTFAGEPDLPPWLRPNR